MPSSLPDFLIIGAARAGTTSLYQYIRQHPQIFLPRNKEPMFFALEDEVPAFSGPGDDKEINRKSVTSLQEYRKLFSGVDGEKVVGEASALYLYSPVAVERIQSHVPDVKLIAILRNPVERAYSSYLYTIRDRRETIRDFASALASESARIDNGWEHIWHYKMMGFYGRQLQRYYSCFDKGQIKVFLYEDLQEKPLEMVKEVFEFLGVDAEFKPDLSLQYNQGGVPKKAWLNKFLTQPSRIKTLIKPMMPARMMRLYTEVKHKNLEKPILEQSVREGLIEEYKSDIELLQDLLGRDLSAWTRV